MSIIIGPVPGHGGDVASVNTKTGVVVLSASVVGAADDPHALGGVSHSGVLPWGDIDKTGSNLSDLAARAHSDTTGIGADDHHNQSHALSGGIIHTGTLNWNDVDKGGSNITDMASRAHNDLTGIGVADHHVRYADAEAVTAMGVLGNGNPLNHARFTAAEALSVARVAAVTTVNVASYDLLSADDILHVTRTATGTCAIDLKTAQTTSGRVLTVKDAAGNAAAFNITVTTEAGELIDGQASAVISGDYDAIDLYSNGTDWFVI